MTTRCGSSSKDNSNGAHRRGKESWRICLKRVDEIERGKSMSTDKQLREHLVYLLGGGGAHVGFEAVVKDFPVEIINRKAEHVPYTPWQVLEHMRIAQWDILEFSSDAAH